MRKNTIKDWSDDDQPREKLLLNGPELLSNAELLAILINNGVPGKNAVELARELLDASGQHIPTLAAFSVKELVNLKIKGIGPAKAIFLAAALELGIRRNAAGKKKKVISCSNDIADYLHERFKYKKNEMFSVVFLNHGNRVLHMDIISEGGVTGTVADPRIILKKALEYDATTLILCHNHPGGNLTPSRADHQVTEKLKRAALCFDIRILDHIIVSEEGYFSFADAGVL